MADGDFDGFDQMARPLLDLVRRLTGLETTFITEIDWVGQQQSVVLALNTRELHVAEGSSLPWADSMCRWSFLSGRAHTAQVEIDFPGSIGGGELGMQTFVAMPIRDGDDIVGTVCGASQDAIDLDPEVLVDLDLIAQALAFQLVAHMEAQELRRRATEAEALALVDPLTGLANRRGFDARYEQELARSARYDVPVALLAMDIDDFKVVNDSFGHVAGDDVLVAAADVLRRAARASDLPARLGGDEFVLLLSPGDERVAQTVAERIVEEFQAATEQLQMPCSLSIGSSTSETTPLRALVLVADESLYRAKAIKAIRA
jgi:diguanylate cyclase